MRARGFGCAASPRPWPVCSGRLQGLRTADDKQDMTPQEEFEDWAIFLGPREECVVRASQRVQLHQPEHVVSSQPSRLV